MNLFYEIRYEWLHGSAFEYLRTNSSGFTDFGRDPFTEPTDPPPFTGISSAGRLAAP